MRCAAWCSDAFGKDEQRNREQATNVDTEVMQQRLARVDRRDSSGDKRPHGDGQPRQQREKDRPAAGADTLLPG